MGRGLFLLFDMWQFDPQCNYCTRKCGAGPSMCWLGSGQAWYWKCTAWGV